MSTPLLRWGILGAAQIARKNWQAIRLSGNSTVVALASRDLDRARAFVKSCQAEAPMGQMPKVFDSYEEVLGLKEVDAVYLPLPTALRKQWVIRAAEAGKHVVCEKPCAVSVADLEEMIAACRRNGVQFMDGVMFLHSRRLNKMREILDDGSSVGPLSRVSSAFTFTGGAGFFEGNIRAHPHLEPHGCLGDLGWYCIKLSLWAMNWKMPKVVSARLIAEHEVPGIDWRVPTDFSAELDFGGGASASFHCSFLAQNQQWAVLSGPKGYVQVPDFVLPFAGPELSFSVQQADYAMKGCDFQMTEGARRITVAEHANSGPDAQEANLFRSFAERVRSGAPDEFWHETALKTQAVMNACFDAALAQRA